ncbi:hypothetical protein ACFWF7_11410 [Nocardia sp. NPDC060256]|uniref:hypothetical protein n=1 Tax=unclassified Nocardia TaxID=2637762 RepID=UPI00364DCE84
MAGESTNTRSHRSLIGSMRSIAGLAGRSVVGSAGPGPSAEPLLGLDGSEGAADNWGAPNATAPETSAALTKTLETQRRTLRRDSMRPILPEMP